MKTIIIVAYQSGIIYKLLCTDIFKAFANGSIELFETFIGENPVPESDMKRIKLVADLYMFVMMIITSMLWPIELLYNLFRKIKNKCWQIRFIIRLKKLRKMLEIMEVGKD